VPEEQAKAHARAVKDIVDNSLSTKMDIEFLRRDMKEMETHLEAKIALTAAETKSDLVKWIARMLVAQAAVVATLVKLL